MLKDNNNKNKYTFFNQVNRELLIYIFLLLTFGTTSFFSMIQLSQAAETTTTTTDTAISAEEKAAIEKKVDKLDDKIDDKQADLQELEQKAKNYQRLINLKKQQQTSLKNQLELMDLQVDNIGNNIDITKKEIEENVYQINQLQVQVDRKDQEMQQVKEKLAEMLRSYSEFDEELGMELLASSNDMASYLNSSEYLDQTSQKVASVLNQVAEKKLEIEEKKQEMEDKNIDLKGKKNQLDEKMYYLNDEKENKDVLLKQTAGEEAKYQQMLQRVEQQKQELIGDIDSLSGDKQDELAKIKTNAEKPSSSGSASTSWYYSQKDSGWGYNRIGLSSSLIKDYGCALTSLAMVFTFHKSPISPGKMAKQPIFSRDLIVWPQIWQTLSLSDDGHAHGNINWSRVDQEIKQGNPVIVFVRAGAGKGHYVVVHSKDKNGKYVVHDPLFGANIYLDTTKKLVGAIYNTTTTVDQMMIYK